MRADTQRWLFLPRCFVLDVFSHCSLCRYTEVSAMLLLSKLQGTESSDQRAGSTNAPLAKDTLCDSLNAMDSGEPGNMGIAVVDVADI